MTAQASPPEGHLRAIIVTIIFVIIIIINLSNVQRSYHQILLLTFLVEFIHVEI
jgi:hypothetical protein